MSLAIQVINRDICGGGEKLVILGHVRMCMPWNTINCTVLHCDVQTCKEKFRKISSRYLRRYKISWVVKNSLPACLRENRRRLGQASIWASLVINPIRKHSHDHYWYYCSILLNYKSSISQYMNQCEGPRFKALTLDPTLYPAYRDDDSLLLTEWPETQHQWRTLKSRLLTYL